MANLSVLAPRDHGNTDGVDPDSCDDVHVTDVLIDVGDGALPHTQHTQSARRTMRCHT